MQAHRIVIITCIPYCFNEPIMRPDCDEPSDCETVQATLKLLSHSLILFVMRSPRSK